MRGRKLKTIFLVSMIFSEKADSVILLGFECSINTQNLNKIVGAIFEKIKIINFFLMWTTLNFRVRVKNINKGSGYLRDDTRYRFRTRSVDCFKQETHYERPARHVTSRHVTSRHGPNGPNGKQLRVTHYERPARRGTSRHGTALMVVMESKWE